MNAIHIETPDISKSYMVITLEGKQFTNSKKSAEAVQTVTDRYGCTRTPGNFSKQLLERKGTPLENLSGIITQARRYVKEVTAPWEDGKRLVDVTKVTEVELELERLRDEFDRQKAKAGHVYDDLIQDAADGLGSLFNPDEYPDKADFLGRFFLGWNLEPVPDGTQFDKLVGVSKEQARRLKEALEADIQRKAAESQARTFGELVDQLSTFWSQLTAEVEDKDGEKKPKPVNKKTVANMRKLLDAIPGKNVLGDDALENARKTLLGEIDKAGGAEGIKKEPEKRKALAKATQGALADLEKSMGRRGKK